MRGIRLSEDFHWFAAARHGGGGKGGGGGGTTTTQVQYSPQEDARRQQVFNIGEQLYNAQSPTAGEYRGPAPVGFDPASLAAQAVSTINSGYGESVVPGTARAVNFALNDAKDVNSNPYLQSAIRAAIQPQVQTFTDTTLPSLRLGATASGTLGSSRQGVAEGVAARGLGQSVANTAASMANTGYNSGLDASLQAIRAIPSVMSGFSAPGSMLSAVGAQRENLAQEVENYNAAKRIQEINGPWDLLNSWAGMIQGLSNPITQTTGTVPRQGISPLQGIGALGSIVSLAGKL